MQGSDAEGLDLFKLPFAQRWEMVGNPSTRVQTNAKHIALDGPTKDSVAYRTWYDSLGDLSTEPDMELPTPIPHYSRTDVSFKLREEYKPFVDQKRKGRRASISEAGSPLRRGSMLRRMSVGGLVKTELPQWKPLHPGSQVQVLDRPDYVARVRSGLGGLQSRPQSSPDLSNSLRSRPQSSPDLGKQQVGANRTRSESEIHRTTMAEEEQELQRQRKIKQLEKVRIKDTANNELGNLMLPQSRGSILSHSNSISEQFDKLKAFAEGAEAKGKRTYGSLMRKKSKIHQATEAEWETVQAFWEWCKTTFGNLTKAFYGIDFNRSGSISSVEFADGLRSKNYPGNETTYKNIFFLFDADQDGVIGKEEFMGSKLRPPKSADVDDPSAPQEDGDERRFSKDPFAQMMPGEGKPRKSIIEQKRATMVKKLWDQDPLVSQFIQNLYITYKSLRQAFRDIDINRNGLLSKSEFKDGLRILKVGKRNMLDQHVDDLFDRIDLDYSGFITLEEMTAETADPLVKRFVKYLTEIRKDFHSRHENETKKDIDPEELRVARLGRVFHRLDEDQSKGIDKEEFIAAMKRMRYIDWHSNDLFDRLDKDGSGQLDAGEFTAFLEREPVSKKKTEERKESKEEAEDNTEVLHDEATKKFQEKFETGATSLMFNTKLQRIGFRSATVDKVRLGYQAGATDSGAGGWTTDTSGVSVRVREDYIGKIRQQLVLPKNSKLRSEGGMSFGVLPEHPGDHLPLCDGMFYLGRKPVGRPSTSPNF